MISRQPLFALLWLTLLSFGSPAQTVDDLARLDPSDVYFQGWLLVRDGEKLEREEKPGEALEKYRKASLFFVALESRHPDWKPEMVKGRRASTSASIQRMRPGAVAEQKAEEKKFEGLVERPAPRDNRPDLKPQAQPQPQPNEAEKLSLEITRLRQQLQETANQRDANAARLRRALADAEAARERIMAGPVKAEMDALRTQINDLSRERETLSTELLKSRVTLRKSQLELDNTRRDLIASRKKETELLELIEDQRQVNFEVVKGQQEQLAALRKKLEEKDTLLAKSDTRIRNLLGRLESSQAMVAELTDERDGLVKERDHMAALLKVNAADRVQELINQNVSLSRAYNEAMEKVAILDADTNATKDDLLEAKRSLTVAKARIINLQEESTRANLSLRELQEKLELAQQDLLARAEGPDLTDAAQEEIKTLRDIIDRQKKSLQVQAEARKLILDQAKREGAEDENWKTAIKLIEGEENLALTAEQEALLADGGTDFAAINRFRATPEERLRAGTRLQRDKADYNRLAFRSFGSGRLAMAEQFFETILEDDPGDWEASMNLGIVLLKQDKPAEAAERFRYAIQLKGEKSLPYAHFQLGVSYYHTELLDDAEQELNTSLAIQPENAKAHVFLGNIAGRQSRFTEAEHHFNEALTLDSALPEPYLNLAALRISQGKQDEAREFYRQALKRGAAAIPSFENQIGLLPSS